VVVDFVKLFLMRSASATVKPQLNRNIMLYDQLYYWVFVSKDMSIIVFTNLPFLPSLPPSLPPQRTEAQVGTGTEETETETETGEGIVGIGRDRGPRHAAGEETEDGKDKRGSGEGRND